MDMINCAGRIVLFDPPLDRGLCVGVVEPLPHGNALRQVQQGIGAKSDYADILLFQFIGGLVSADVGDRVALPPKLPGSQKCDCRRTALRSGEIIDDDDSVDRDHVFICPARLFCLGF